MTEVSEDFKNLELDCNIFKDVKYYITGEVEENVLELLRNGGAERMNYFSDYVTHLICGSEPEDTDLSDAVEVYEIPAVTIKWVTYSSHLRRLLSTTPYLYNVNKLFSNLNFCFSSVGRDRNLLWAIITFHGGNVQANLDNNCNYLITTSTTSEKYLKVLSLEQENIFIVTPDWVIETVRNKSFAPVEIYHPRLIAWPKIVKHESTTAITGFEPDELNPTDSDLDNILPDSTQALLEELKQRMPWNQPQTSLSNEAAPPNVVAPSYTGSKLQPQHQQEVQQRLFNQPQQQINIQKSQAQPQQLNFLPPSTQIPRSIVHHPPQSPLPQQNQQQLQFTVNQPQQQQQAQQQQPQIAFSQANLTSSQRLRIIEQMQQNRAQRLQQNQFNQLQQQQRVQQLQQQQQQVNQLQQENPMGQVNQQQQVVNQLRQATQPQQQQVGQPNQQQLILGAQNQENQRQLLQTIQQQQGQQQQLIQNQQLRSGGQPQQVAALTQLQMVQNQPQQQQHSTLNQLAKPTPANIQQQQHLSPQQLLQRQLQNQHLLKSQHLLQNQQQQLQNQLNQQNQPGQQQQTQLNQQLSQDQLQQQLSQQTHLEQQLSQQTQLNQPQQQLNQRQLNQLNQHLLQNQLVQQNQQNQLTQQQQIRQNQISAQQQQQLNQLSQNRLNIQQQQSKIMQNQFNQQQAQQQQIINQQTVVVSQNQQNVLQQQFGSPNSQQFQQQQAFVQQQTQFNQPQPTQQLIQTPQGQQQVIACQQQQQQQQQLLAQQQMKPQQIIGQQQLVNQKLNIQQIGGQQHILLQQQQPQQVQGTQESPQRSTNQHIWQQQPPAPSPAPTPQPQQAQINIQRHPNVPGQGPRVQWAPNQQPGVVLPQRQYIHLDEQTHQQLQQMSPEDRALFVQKLHKHRQQVLQSRMQAQQQQRAGHILIRGGVPIGLNSQQQMQWLQQQAKQQGVVLQQQTVSQSTIVQQANPNLQHTTPGLSPIQQQTQFTDQNQQLQLQRQQQQQQLRLQQLQLHQQREQAQKTVLQQPQGQPALAQPAQPTVVRALVQSQVVEGTGVVPGPSPVVVDPNVVQAPQSPLVVNSKTKTALANMLNTRLQSGGSTLSENIAEPSAAGTLKLMTQQHHAAVNRPHDLLFLQQRRIINRPSTEVIRPPPSQSVPPGPQIDPPKLQYSPRNSVPLQHRPGTYYGHNPNLKLPPDLFLLGCVFVVVELERFLDESMPGWQKKIEKHGGEIEKQYCNRVTHVICETQRHGVVMQALRDFKRCVTLYWLSDVINRKQVLPPWIALHLPTMYWDTAPASKHLICLTGFLATERERVKHMIKYIGAGLTTYFSKHNTLLITTKAEGPKYNHAKKWGTPIVNVQWLTDIMLGHFTALNQLEHVKYQHFTDPPNFSFDPLLVPNLMHAWKMPINISQESYEKVKRSASPVVIPPNSKPKKIKLEQTMVTDENDNEDLILQSTATYRVMLSMCVDVDELKKIIRQLGGIITKSFSDCTHLIMPQLKRTHKLLCSICVGSYIVPESWLRDSHAAGKFLDESNYTLDTKDFNSEFKCDFNQTLSTKNRNKLFEGKHFFITPSIVPRKKELIELIEFCGGNVERNRRTLAQIEATNVSSPYSYIILTHENDLHLVADLLKNKKDKVRIVCNSELVLSAILKQTFEVEPYAVKFL